MPRNFSKNWKRNWRDKMEFWNEAIVERSFEILKKISREFDFILIGGWAVYLCTKGAKSQDIDIIIEYEALDYLKKNYDLKKNDSLKKYEIVLNEVDIDIYLPYFSQFPIPVEDVVKKKAMIEGFTTLPPEMLLILKQKAEFDRRDSVKGQKDRLDIISLLTRTGIDWAEYRRLLEKHNLQKYSSELLRLIKQFDAPEYLNMNPRQFKLWKKGIEEKIRHKTASGTGKI